MPVEPHVAATSKHSAFGKYGAVAFPEAFPHYGAILTATASSAADASRERLGGNLCILFPFADTCGRVGPMRPSRALLHSLQREGFRM